jgi:release factor glutamine methyltransferase
MKLIEVLDFGSEQLTGYCSNPEFESFIFLEEATGKNREKILIDEEEIEDNDFIKFENYLKRRIKGIPWQYIIGYTNFLGFQIYTDREVFIPRPETEWLVLMAIRKLKDYENPFVLEIGAGTGAISISIASFVNSAKIIATDISQEAVKLCKKNVKYHNLNRNIDIVCGDLFDCFDKRVSFDMIISNPPYIPEKDLETLDDIVKKEPILALNGGEEGVAVINTILKRANHLLRRGGHIFIEIDGLNIPYIEVPKSINYSILDDQFGRNRILSGVKI